MMVVKNIPFPNPSRYDSAPHTWFRMNRPRLAALVSRHRLNAVPLGAPGLGGVPGALVAQVRVIVGVQVDAAPFAGAHRLAKVILVTEVGLIVVRLLVALPLTPVAGTAPRRLRATMGAVTAVLDVLAAVAQPAFRQFGLERLGLALPLQPGLLPPAPATAPFAVLARFLLRHGAHPFFALAGLPRPSRASTRCQKLRTSCSSCRVRASALASMARSRKATASRRSLSVTG